ncbi:N-6 DNA methylase [Amycolatopsis sp. FDAARGOS 1241]|uniref:N-6 DNA methylase n=1 Tax=Amycolatopsis sp. FDAARGOS 1241 TaxID=2778070 RepID=UPI0019501040|nr:N-6 DNA methylase [Amycolatopsis sp. FDAARGOS 1241]QRP43640.1 N-6 DNA methylase [Amycolatopsis sp. FDAARGOS 1241]
MADESEVTAAEIARLAGVGRAAVSNWRKRFTDFPQPIDGTDTSPRFRSAEILTWLEDQGKLGAESARELVWQRLADSGSDSVVDRVAAAGEYLAGRQPATDLDKRTREALDALAADGGAESAFDELCGRFVTANWRTMAVTTPELAEFMVGLAAPLGGSLFDPACGLGSVLRAAAQAKPDIAVLGQEFDAPLARLATVRLAFSGADSTIETGDSLRRDAFPELRADAVVCNPPFNDRNWGAEELAYDQRWAFGLPPKGESELAWVQHCLAHLRRGGRAVLLMPPAAASRRSGRPIRAELLRRGAVRAIVQLPAGAAPPLGLSLQLWILEQPAEQTPDARVLFIDGTAGLAQRIDEVGWPALRERVDPVWANFVAGPGTVAEAPGRHTVRSVIDLLDDEVDLTPARYLRAAADLDVTALRTTQRSFAKLLAELAELLPDVQPTLADASPKATVSIGELQRSGAVSLRQQTARMEVQPGGEGLPVYTARDIISGEPPAGRIAAEAACIAVLPGDVLVPTVLTSAAAVVVTEAGAALGPHVQLLRPDPNQIDSWFLAGFLRSRGSLRFASTMSGTRRIDVRRVEVPRTPIAEQRKYAAAFELLARFDATLARASNLGHELTQSLTDGLAAGALTPAERSARKPAT